MGFPVFFAGIRPVDSKGRGRVMAYDVPIRCGDVLVQTGELVYSDFDGVVVVPRDVEDTALSLAYEKLHKENLSRRDLLAGHTLRQVFDEYGVL
jgi:4-hydroxy-4-methyl-2-oxoglutarate aldolase